MADPPQATTGVYDLQGIGQQWVVSCYPDMEILRPMLAYFACRGVGAKTILDCGGKDAEVSKYMQSWAEITVLDADLGWREKAIASGAWKFIHGRVEEVKKAVGKARFDAVLLMEILEHLRSVSEAAEVVSDCADIGKVVVITTPCERDWSTRRGPFSNPDHTIQWNDVTFTEMMRLASCGVLLADRVRLAGISHYFAVLTKKKELEVKDLPREDRIRLGLG